MPTEATYCNTEDDDAYLIPTPSIEATLQPTNVLHTHQSDRTSAISLQDYSSESVYTTISENIERLLPLGSGSSENTGTRLGLISNDKFLFTYNATKAVWKKRLKIPKWFDSSTAYCVCKDNVVVVGNANRQTGCYVRWINITNTEMTDLPNLPDSIAGAGVACVSAYIYVLGGTRFCQGQWIKSNAVYCYKRDSGAAQWSNLDGMPCAVSCPIVTVIGDNIFVLGGNDASRSPTSSVQIFNTTKLSWTTMQPLPQSCTARDGGATCYKGRLIVLTKSMLIELEADNTWSVRERYHHAVDNVNPVVLNNHVFACVKNSAGYRVMELLGRIHRWTRKDIDISNCFNQYYVFTFNG